jgi:hypothetical protein
LARVWLVRDRSGAAAGSARLKVLGSTVLSLLDRRIA